MYYVLYVGEGKENHAENFIRSFVPEQFYSNCFHVLRHMKKKLRGTWCDIYSRLAPGYIFVESDQIESFSTEALKTLLPLKVLGMEKDQEGKFFQPLSETEEAWLRMLVPEEDKGITCPTTADKTSYIVELSQVAFDENGQAYIASGPLKNLQEQIKKINLHQRFAEVEMDFLGDKKSIYLGIEF